MPKPLLKKNTSGIIYPIAEDDTTVHAFPKVIFLKVYVIAWLEFKLAYYYVASNTLAFT